MQQRVAVAKAEAKRRRCAIYTRKSSEEGLEQEFNSLAAQREACEAYIRSQQHEGWVLTRTRYDDGRFSGGNIERPALQALQCRPPDVATREPAIIVAGSGQYPAFMLLAADIGFTSFVLRFERVELLLQPLLGGFAGVDR